MSVVSQSSVSVWIKFGALLRLAGVKNLLAFRGFPTNQNGVSSLDFMLEIHYSGREPSI